MKHAILIGSTVVLAGVPLLLGQSERRSEDPVSKLDRRLASGEAELAYSERGGYLPSLLKSLDINTDSQILIFSKTSFQGDLISPQKPRALYFNDDTIIGVVQNAPVLEVISLDPTEGVTFFSLATGQTEKPRLKSERGSCTFCHGPINRYAQGVMVATVFTAPDGKPFFSQGEGLFHLTDHRSPFEDRWGGYYVTGTSGTIRHRGNAFAPDPAKPRQLDLTGTSNVTSLEGRLDLSPYLAPTSDIVALMTLEHQTMATNLLTSIGAQFRAAETFPVPAEELAAEVDKLVSFLLFDNETKLESPIKGVSTFTETFQKRGPRDAKGRSLRDFDLQTRMFKYPLSYMIYTATFDGLPAKARDQIYRRIYDRLTGSGQRDVLDVLVGTKTGLPEYFRN